jgi:hypothetical protein
VRSIRILSIVVLALVAVYYVFRAVAAACSGAACDAYIPFSLLLPILILVASAITGAVAIALSRKDGPIWTAVLLTATVLGVIGPIGALAIFRDQPDVLVPVATGLELLVPLCALAYTWSRRSTRGAEGESPC